jgi:hypothetical protein
MQMELAWRDGVLIPAQKAEPEDLNAQNLVGAAGALPIKRVLALRVGPSPPTEW